MKYEVQFLEKKFHDFIIISKGGATHPNATHKCVFNVTD
jgi:hypothetical protein